MNDAVLHVPTVLCATPAHADVPCYDKAIVARPPTHHCHRRCPAANTTDTVTHHTTTRHRVARICLPPAVIQRYLAGTTVRTGLRWLAAVARVRRVRGACGWGRGVVRGVGLLNRLCAVMRVLRAANHPHVERFALVQESNVIATIPVDSFWCLFLKMVWKIRIISIFSSFFSFFTNWIVVLHPHSSECNSQAISLGFGITFGNPIKRNKQF